MTQTAITPLPHVECERSFGRRRLWLRSGSWLRMRRPWTNQPHRHGDFHELVLVTHGRGTYHHGADSWPLRPGSLFISDLDVVHEIECRASTNLAFAWVSLRLRGGGRAESWPERVLAAFAAGHHIVRHDQHHLCEHLPLLVRSAGERNASAWRREQLLVTWAIEGLAALLGDDVPPVDEQAPASHMIAEAIAFIEDRLHEDLTVGTVADHLGLGERHLRRIVARHLDTTVQAIIAERRVSAACRLLAMGQSVQATAAAVGLGSASALSRCFKRHTGRSPKEYRREQAPRAELGLTTFGK